MNLILFGTFSKDGSISRHSLENILLFIPFGLLVPMFTRLLRRWWNLVLMAFTGSMVIETTQLITARGYFELDDIVLNTFGALIGYIVFAICYHSFIAIKRETKIPLNRHEIQINRVTLFVIQLLPVVLMVMLIFGFSSQNAEESGELCRFVTEKLLYIFNKLLRIGMTAEKIENSVVEYEGLVRKIAHMIEFSVLTFFTFAFWYCRKISNYLSFIFSFVFVGIISVADEKLQAYSIGRNSSFADVCIDMLASVTVLFVMLVILAILRFYHAGGKITHLLFDND